MSFGTLRNAIIILFRNQRTTPHCYLAFSLLPQTNKVSWGGTKNLLTHLRMHSLLLPLTTPIVSRFQMMTWRSSARIHPSLMTLRQQLQYQPYINQLKLLNSILTPLNSLSLALQLRRRRKCYARRRGHSVTLSLSFRSELKS